MKVLVLLITTLGSGQVLALNYQVGSFAQGAQVQIQKDLKIKKTKREIAKERQNKEVEKYSYLEELRAKFNR